MLCSRCGNEPPDYSRFCNMCGYPFTGNLPTKQAPLHVKRRWIFVDLADLSLAGPISSDDQRATIVSYLYERFTPFADDGWEWHVQPTDPQFSGWIYRISQEGLLLIGAQLHCRCVVTMESLAAIDPQHHVSEHRLRQLVQHRELT
jgi:hypothetical protein